MVHDSPPQHEPHSRLRPLLGVVGMLLAAGILLAAFFRTPWEQESIDPPNLEFHIPDPKPVNLDFSGYVGEDACAKCHSGETAAHSGSGHRRTLWPAGDGSLARKQLKIGQEPFGRTLNSDRVRDCLSCHATLTSRKKLDHLDPATLVPNVSCERCHGPGRAHIEAARDGKTDDLKMPMTLLTEPQYQVQQCGEAIAFPRRSTAPASTPTTRTSSGSGPSACRSRPAFKTASVRSSAPPVMMRMPARPAIRPLTIPSVSRAISPLVRGVLALSRPGKTASTATCRNGTSPVASCSRTTGSAVQRPQVTTSPTIGRTSMPGLARCIKVNMSNAV